MKKVFPALLILTELLITLAGCGGGQTTPTTPKTTSQPPATTSTPPPTTSASPTTTAPPATTQRIDYMPTPSNPKDQPSYRYSSMTNIKEGDGAGTVSTYKAEWVRENQAEHAWIEDGTGKVTELFIIIGANQWSYTGQGWVKQAPTGVTKPFDVAAQLKEALKDPVASKARVVKKSTNDVVNNAIVDKYEIEFTLAGAHTIGEIWLGSGMGSPSIIMKANLTTDSTVQGKKTVVYNEQNYYDIDRVNTPITPPV